MGKAATSIVADVAEDGKLSPLTVATVAGHLLLKDLPGGPTVDLAAQRFAELAAKRAMEGKAAPRIC
jgi:hypothetical protein